ncbi:hypothetical protein [Roseovarius autotrophicus]|uniref:hypothetical protein n=1 Tax=Roseovarius autotrophicus TaxID=2824121 RepID=UPI001B35E2CE|nr:hypothetical protein [Roseovarius autotrophicus]
MSARRDPEGRLPEGAAVVMALIVAAMVWAGVGSWIVVSVLRPFPAVYQENSHETR